MSEGAPGVLDTFDEFDLDRLAREIHTLDGAVPDGGDAAATPDGDPGTDDAEVSE
jgi:hypothetical protein